VQESFSDAVSSSHSPSHDFVELLLGLEPAK
jgi:hypothetical protein